MADPVDPEFEDLFRPDEDEVAFADAFAGPAGAGESAPADSAEGSGDHGRLFRSQGVMAFPDAELAIPIGSRLKTLARTGGDPDDLFIDDDVDDVSPVAASPALAASMANERDRVVPVTSTSDSSRSADAPRMSDAHDTGAPSRGSTDAGEDTASVFGPRSIPAIAIWLIIGGLTLVVGFINAIVGGGHLGWPTGLALFASTIACALAARRSDLIYVIVAPPLMFLLATLTAGQLSISGSGLLDRIVQVFFTLGDNWIWIVGAVVAAIALTVFRRLALQR